MIQETISQIEARLMAKLKATPPYSTINLSPSSVALFSNFLNTVATEIFTLEQLNNLFETEIEGIIAGVTTPTTLWWQQQILKFQYSLTNPQVVQMDTVNFFPFYPIVNTAYRIISNCAVVTASNNQVQIKVTNNGSVLNAAQILALTAYIQTIDPAGISWVIINALPDRLYMVADIYYNGQYAPVIQANVIASLNSFLKALPFNSVVKISALEDAIQAVAGVTDVVISEVAGRQQITPWASRSIFPKSYTSYSGQIIQEDTAGKTFSDSGILNFIASS